MPTYGRYGSVPCEGGLALPIRMGDAFGRSAMMDAAENKQIVTLQALRGIAAAMIVLLHAESVVQIYADSHGYHFLRTSSFPLAAGVDLFFVISGFVIVYASNKLFAAPGGALVFLRRRLIRILPLYWSALTLRLIVLGFATALGTKTFPSLAAITTSYLFIPFDSLGFGSPYLFPILDLGWTLNYEMFFYVLFACFLALSRDRAVLTFVGCIFVIAIAATAAPPASAVLHFWSQPIIMEFGFGTLIALAFVRGYTLPAPLRLVFVTAALAIWFGVDSAWFTAPADPGYYAWSRVVVWGSGAALIVAAAVLGSDLRRWRALRAIAALGDSSYALYLLHPFLFLVPKAALTLVVLPAAVLWPLVFVIATFAIAAAALIYRVAEAPVLTFLHFRLASPGTAP